MSGKKKLTIAGMIVLVFVIFNFLFFNSYFLADNIIIEGSERIDEYKVYNIVNKQLQQKRFLFLNQQNIFSFSKRQVKKEILKNYLVDNLEINKNLPKTIKISFNEIIPAAVWCEEEQYYYIDSSLNVLLKIESLEINTNDFIVLKSADRKPQIKTQGVNKKVMVGEEYLRACLGLAKRAKSINLNINNICEINKPEATVDLGVNEGPKIYFNIEDELEKQFKKLEVLLAEKIKGDGLKKLEYIDLRFGEKIYYK